MPGLTQDVNPENLSPSACVNPPGTLGQAAGHGSSQDEQQQLSAHILSAFKNYPVGINPGSNF